MSRQRILDMHVHASAGVGRRREVPQALSATLVVALLSIVGCYEPATADCTVSCTAASDCVDGQVCGRVGLCAAPDVTCPASVGVVELAIEGDGKIAIDKVGTCDTREVADGVCRFSLEQLRSYQLKAIENDDRRFINWTATCAGDALTCVFVPVTSLTRVGARFQWLD